MASDREKAKRSITQRKTQEPELDEAISQAHSLAAALDLKTEDHRHEEAMLGKIGRILGSDSSTSVAFIAVCAGIVGTLFCYGCALHAPATAEFWGKQAERSIAFTVAALSFIFGRTARPRR